MVLVISPSSTLVYYCRTWCGDARYGLCIRQRLNSSSNNAFATFNIFCSGFFVSGKEKCEQV